MMQITDIQIVQESQLLHVVFYATLIRPVNHNLRPPAIVCQMQWAQAG